MSIPLLDGAVAVAYPLVAGLAAWLGPIGGAAAAIVVCTAALRLLLLPLTLTAVRRERSRTSPLAGLLPVLVQTPFVMVWYRIFTAPRIAGQANALLAHAFFGARLSVRLLYGGHPLVFAPLLLALLVLGVVSVRRTRRVAAEAGTPAAGGALLLLPFASLLSALVMPLASVLYLVTTLTWTAVENAALRRGLPSR